MTEDPKTLDPASRELSKEEEALLQKLFGDPPPVPKDILDARTDEEKAKEDGPG